MGSRSEVDLGDSLVFQSGNIDKTDDISHDDSEYPAIYVAGYLALYDLDDGEELTLRRDDARAALPPPSLLPINIDHRQNCTVGAVLCLVDDDLGLFFLGKINCPQFARTLASAASSEIFDYVERSLSPGEKHLYLVTNYLPSVSLSSRRLRPGEKPDETFFAHVALCLLGRRIGTIVNYDTSLEGAVEPFRRLTPAAKHKIVSEALEAETFISDKVWQPSEAAMGRALLGTAVNNMLLRDRWRLVTERRRLAGISGHKYLQASVTTKLPMDSVSREEDFLKEAVPDGETVSVEALQKRATSSETAILSQEVKTQSEAVPPILAPSSTDSAVDPQTTKRGNGETGVSSDHRMSTQPGSSGPSPPGGDFLWVPMSCYNQLVAAQQARNACSATIAAGSADDMSSVTKNYLPGPQYFHPTPFGFPSSMMTTAGPVTVPMPYGPVLSNPGNIGSYWPGRGSFPGGNVEARLMNLLDAYESERRSGPRRDGGAPDRGGWNHGRGDVDGGGWNGRRGRKRPHDWETRMESDPYYPGESGPDRSQAVARLQYRDNDQLEAGETFSLHHDRRNVPGDAIVGLLGAVTSLQRDVDRLKGGQSGLHYQGGQWPSFQQPMISQQRPQDVTYANVRLQPPPLATWKTPSPANGTETQMIVQRPIEQPQAIMEAAPTVPPASIPLPVSQPGSGNSANDCSPPSAQNEQGLPGPSSQSPPTATNSVQQGTTVDASAVARLPYVMGSTRTEGSGDQEADMFVTQMMSHRV